MRGDHPVVCAASWMVRASICRLRLANPDTTVSRLGRRVRPAMATGAEVITQALEDAGVEVAFGLPGVHNLPLWDAVRQSSIRLVGVRHEQAAAYAADGYARATGRLRSEEHTSELQSRQYLVCRLLLEKKKIYYTTFHDVRHPLSILTTSLFYYLFLFMLPVHVNCTLYSHHSRHPQPLNSHHHTFSYHL